MMRKYQMIPRLLAGSQNIRAQRVARPSQKEVAEAIKKAKEVELKQIGVLVLQQNP